MSSEKRKKIFLLIGVILILGILIYALYHFGKPYLSFLSDYKQVRDWAKASGFKGKILFTLIIALQVVVAVIPGGPMEIAAGYAYGPVVGTILSLLGIVLGATLVYFLVKRFGKPFIHLFVSEEKLSQMSLFQNENRLKRIIFIIFLLPGTPKDLLTYMVGLTKMSLSTWLILTTFARTPATIVSTYAGEALLKKDYGQVAIIFIIGMVLAIIGYYIFNKLNEKRVEKKP